MDFDPLGRLSRFDTLISLPGNGDTTVSQANTAVHMMGTIDGPKLALWIRIGGGKPSESSVSVPRNVMIRDAFSPQSRLPDLHEGQTWTVETYSPLQMPGNDDPKEMLYAKVEGSARLNVGDQPVDTWVVVFRSDPGSSLGSRGNERGKLWVAKDGRVLKQEAVIFDSKMTFLRQKDDKAAALARQSGMFSPKGDNRTIRGMPHRIWSKMIEFCHVTRKYGSKVAVADLSLVVPRGQLFAFLGPNGAGKTTAIKMLVGLLRPTSGAITVCGASTAADTREVTRFLGFVPDEAFLYDKLSGRRIPAVRGRDAGLDRRRNSLTDRPPVGVVRTRRLPRRPDRNLFSRHAAAVGLRLGLAPRSAGPGAR